MILLRKELLSAVLGFEVDNIHIGRQYIHYHIINSSMFKINVYELMHMMKVWAYSEGYSLKSYRNTINACVCDIRKNGLGDIHGTIEYTEPEAVTKACEWILEQQK